MGVVGAAVATVVGQVASLVMAMLFHYRWDREIRQDWKRIRPRWGLIRGIYAIGIPAAVMQGLLSVMVLFVNLVFGTQEIWRSHCRLPMAFIIRFSNLPFLQRSA